LNKKTLIILTLLIPAMASAIFYYINSGNRMTDEIKIGKNSPDTKQDEWVVLVHGLLSGPGALSSIAKELQLNGYGVFSFRYDSRKQSIKSSSENLGKEIEEKIPPEAKKINFVAHSLGAIIVRFYLSGPGDKRTGRFVMIAPPNQGSTWGRTLAKNVPLFRYLLGVAGREVQYTPAVRLKGPPPCEFGIIAGGMGNDTGLNPFIEGDDDGTISVPETRLDGASDYIIIRGHPTLLLPQKEVIDNVLSFLKTGKFLYR